MVHGNSSVFDTPVEGAILYADRITGTCGRCRATLCHPLGDECPDCGVEFTGLMSTIFGGSDESVQTLTQQLSNVPYLGRGLPR